MPDNMTTTGGGSANISDEPPRPGQGFPPENAENPYCGPDDYTRFVQTERANRRPVTRLAGNIADLNRLAAVAADGKSVKEVLSVHPTVDVSDSAVKSGVIADADAGVWNVGTEGLGLVDAPPEPVPAENTDANIVDPTSQHPVAEEKGKKGTTTTSSASPTAQPKR